MGRGKNPLREKTKEAEKAEVQHWDLAMGATVLKPSKLAYLQKLSRNYQIGPRETHNSLKEWKVWGGRTASHTELRKGRGKAGNVQERKKGHLG